MLEKNISILGKVIIWIFYGLFILGCLAMVVGFFLYAYADRKAEQNLREMMEPVAPETIEYLCKVFEIDPSSWKCDPSGEVRSYDYYFDIVEKLAPEDGQWGSFEQVDSLIGKYLLSCTSFKETEKRRCEYNFAGEEIDPLILFFDFEGTLINFDFFELNL